MRLLKPGKHLCLVIGMLIGFTQIIRAQTQVQVTINVMPPYSSYLQDYAGAGQQLQVLIRNLTLTALDVRLQGRVEGDNGVLIQTLPNFRPTRPLKLAPGETRILSRADLEGSFDLNQISVEGVSKDLLYQGKPLPEGNYQVCVQVFDNRTSQPLSSGFPLGCSPPFSIRTIEPPILISPLCDTDITPTTPQATVFTWAPPAGILPTQVSYILRIIELPLDNVDPNVFIDAVALPPSGVEVKNLMTSTFLYGPQYLPLKVGKRYAWRVQAVDRLGKLNLLNDGKSPVCAFRYGQPIVADSLGLPMTDYLVFIKPGEPTGKKLPELSVGYGNPLYLNWGLSSKMATQLAMIFPQANLMQQSNTLYSIPGSSLQKPNQQIALPNQNNNEQTYLKSLDLTKTNLSYRVRIRPVDKSGKTGAVVLDRQVKTAYLSAEQADLPPGIVAQAPYGPEKNYQAEVELVGLTAAQIKQLNLPAGNLTAEPRKFSLVRKNTGNQSDTVYVKGLLVYKYPGETGSGHIMPNTMVTLKRVEASGYENNMGYATTNSAGEFTVGLPRWQVSPTDTIISDKKVAVSGSFNNTGSSTVTKTVKDTSYYNAGYRIVPNNIYLMPAELTFSLSPKQVGTFDAGTIPVVAKAYTVRITARQAYKDWPGAPTINLAGKRLVIFRKPNKQVDTYKLPVEGQMDRGTSSAQAKSGSKPASASETAAQTEVEKAGYVFVGTTLLLADGNAYQANLERFLYAYNPLDRYAIYCPDCGQKPDDAETFRFDLPKQPLSATVARTESYTFNVQTTEAPVMTFSGKLTYKYADKGLEGAQVKPLSNTRVRLQVVYTIKGKNAYTTVIPSFPELTSFHEKFSTLLDTKVTGDDGSFTFSAKLPGPLQLGELPPTVSTKTGEFGMGSTVYIRALRVVVDNPYYTSPSATFGDDAKEQMLPQGSYDFGTITAVVRSYSLITQIRSDVTGEKGGNQQVNGIKQSLSGVKVYAIRENRKGYFPLSPITGPPLDEGQGLTDKKAFGESSINYIVVAQGVSNAEGTVIFPRMVMADGKDDTYLIATEASVDGINAYQMNGKPKRILVSEDYGDLYSKTATESEKKLAESKNKVLTVDGDKCKTVWHVYIKQPGGSTVEYTYDESIPNQAKILDGYRQMAKTDPDVSVSPQTTCDKVKSYWIGSGLGDRAINNKVLLSSAPEFADDYKPFLSDTVKRFLNPANPIINVRVIDKTNPTQGIANADIRLTYIQANGNAYAEWRKTDANGWIAEPFMVNPGTKATLKVLADGYIFSGYVDPAKGDPEKENAPIAPVDAKQTIDIGSLMLGQNLYYSRMLMQPNTRYTGYTVDQDALELDPKAKNATVEAYVQIGNGNYNKTTYSDAVHAHRFNNVYGAGGNGDSLKIYPVDISYFNESRAISLLPKPEKSDEGAGMFIVKVGKLPIYQRDHRILFNLLALHDNKWGPVKSGTVKLFGRDEKGFVFGPGNAQGLVEARFKNVSVENLFVEVSAPGYVTKTQSVTNVESKSSKTQQVFLEEANLIQGKVVVKTADGKEIPLAGADVFVAGGSNVQTPYSTKSVAGGSFTLAVGKQLSSVTVQATYQNEGGTVGGGSVSINGADVKVGSVVIPAESYVGASSKQSLPQAAKESLKLTLTTFEKYKITTIWGFPVKVESLTALANGAVKASGEVNLRDNRFGPFAILDPELRVRFENVVFIPGNNGTGVPASATVSLKTGILDNLGYYNKPTYKSGDVPLYNIRLSGTGNSSSGGNLQIVQSPGKTTGKIMAQAQIIDNSFKFSENLLSYKKGQFSLYDPDKAIQGNIPLVVAFDASDEPKKRTNFGLCNQKGEPIELELLAFKAISTLEGSRLVGDEIHLNPILSCTVKNANTGNLTDKSSLTINVGDLVLKNNTIDSKSGQTPLTFGLAGKWSVEVRNWVLDYKQGGFYATEGVVKTGKIDVPISLFNLRADFFKLEANNIPNLDLAGIAKVKIGGKAFFGYDEATGNDMKGHWSLVVVPDGKNQAGVVSSNPQANPKLPGLNSDLAFETISLLDNGQDVFSFSAKSQELNYYKGVMTIRPKTIETGDDYFAFDAGMSTSIPNAPKDVPMRLTYYKPGGTGPITLKTVVASDYVIDTKGQVQFVAGQYKAADNSMKTAFYFADGVMAIRGIAKETGKLLLGNPSDLPTDNEKAAGVMLVHSTADAGKTFSTYLTHDRSLDLNKESNVSLLSKKPANTDYYKPLKIDLGNKSFSTVYCDQTVTNGQWNLLTFSGIPANYTMIPATEENRLAFTNYGGITASNQKIKADGLGGKDGIPGVSLEYDMANSRFTGTVTLPPGLPLPPTMSVEYGVAQIRIDGNGFYLASAATVRDVPLIIPVTMKAGLLLGYYDSPDIKDAEPVLFGNTHRKSLPCAFHKSFKGVFVNGELPIPLIDNFEYKQSFGVGEVKMGLNAYVDGYSYADYNAGSFKFGSGLGAGVHFYAYGQVLNVAASGSVDVDGSQDFGLTITGNPLKAMSEPVTVSVNANMQFSAKFNAKLYVDLGIDSYTTSESLGFCLGLTIPNISYTTGGLGSINVATPKFTCNFNACDETSCQSTTQNQ
ncbi:hypothetical protein G8759_08810 [Spirosoma aureum]|uniref:TANFOR domain-containing protein n=1 Tax=Spirosoma aureum TaxID=2692134 RepID=A0A6G9AJT7_9BACT|nr:hypothetical protein [Spirosoma aureum]QIP12718.1 hypothetical protein G8759_08810 [Spirosoma aureum]